MEKYDPKRLQQLIATNIVVLRQKKNILQKDLASKTGIKPIDLARIENGEIDIQLSMLEKIAIALKVPSTIFFISLQNEKRPDINFIERAKFFYNNMDKESMDIILRLMEIFVENRLRVT